MLCALCIILLIKYVLTNFKLTCKIKENIFNSSSCFHYFTITNLCYRTVTKYYKLVIFQIEHILFQKYQTTTQVFITLLFFHGIYVKKKRNSTENNCFKKTEIITKIFFSFKR